MEINDYIEACKALITIQKSMIDLAAFIEAIQDALFSKNIITKEEYEESLNKVKNSNVYKEAMSKCDCSVKELEKLGVD